MPGTELATAYLTLIPSLRGATKQIESQLGGVDTTAAAKRIGSGLGQGIGDNLDLRSAGSKLEDFGGKLADAGDALTSHFTAPLAAAAVGAGAFALSTASAAETTEISFTTMLGSAEAAQSMMEELADFAARTPFELSGLQDATRQLLAYGFTAEDVIPMLTAVGDATAALGTGQAGIEAVTRALGQMQTRGKASAEEMLQLTEAGIPAWEYLARAIGTDTAGAMEAVTDGAVSADAAIAALTQGMEQDFGGMMEAQSKTVAGLMSNLSDAIEQPLMKLRDSDAYDAFADSLQRLVDAAGPFVESMLPHLESGIEAVASVLDAAAGALDEFSSMSEESQERILGLVAGSAAAGPALSVMGRGIQAVGAASKGAGSLLGKLSDGLLNLATSPKTAETVLGRLAGTIASYPGVTALAVGGVALLASGVYDFCMQATKADREARVQAEAMEVLGSAAQVASGSMRQAGGDTEYLGTAIANMSAEIQENWQSIADLGSAFEEIDQRANAQVYSLSSARQAVAQYAGQTDLTAQQQGALRAAIEAVNDQCGTNYSVVRDAGGAYQVMADGANVASGEIYKLIDAQIQQVQVQAQMDKLESLYSEQAEQATEYAEAVTKVKEAQEAYNAAVEKYGEQGANWALDDLKEAQANVDELGAQLDETNASIGAVETSIGNMSAAAQDASGSISSLVTGSGALNTFFSATGGDINDFALDLSSAGVSMEQFSSLSETQLMELAAQWDGSTQSISAALDGLGVDMSDKGLAAANALANGLMSGTVSIDAATGIMQAAAQGDWSGVASQMQAAGITLPDSVAQGIIDGSFQPSEAMDYTLSLVALKLTGGDTVAAAQLLGHDIDEGLAQGILNGTLSESAAQTLGQDVIDSAKTSLQSHSPSQVFVGIGSDIDAGLALGISGNTSGPLGAIGSLIAQILGQTDALDAETLADGSEASSAFATGIGSALGAAVGNAAALASGAADGTAPAASSLSANGTSAGSRFASGIGSAEGSTRTSAATLASRAKEMANVGDMWSSGNHLGQNFAAGIRAAVSLVSSAASAVASAAASVLNFSVPEDGPWSGSEKGGFTSGLHLGENFAAGMMAAVPSVRDAAVQLATAARAPEGGSAFPRRGMTSAPYARGGAVYNISIDGASLDASPAVMDALRLLMTALDRQYNLGEVTA